MKVSYHTENRDGGAYYDVGRRTYSYNKVINPTGKWKVTDFNGKNTLFIEMNHDTQRNMKTGKTKEVRCGFLWLNKKRVEIWELVEVREALYFHEDDIYYTIEYPEQSCA